MDDLKTLSVERLADEAGWRLLGRPLDTREAAQLLGLKPTTLELKRMKGAGPEYMQAEKNSRVLYSERAVLMYLLAGRRRHTAQPHPQLATA